MTKPVIGAINGAAVTGGLELALYCDILIASEQARFADTHARVGLLPTWGLSVRLPQKVGVGMARRMSLTGDYLSAADALRAGLVTEVVPHDELLPTARRVAASIVGNNQNAVRALLASYHRIDEQQTERRAVDRGGVGDAVDERRQRRRHRRQPRRGAAAGPRTGALRLPMNKAHEMCGSDEWRQAIREVILPWALGDTDLGDDVLEVGPGYGATTDVLSQAVPRLTSVEIDDELAAMLRDRFADVPSVEIVNGDATTLGYADESFTGAACFTMLHHVPDRRTAGPAVRRGRPRAAAGRGAGGQRQPGQRRARGPPRGRHLQPRRPRVAAGTAGGGGFRATSTCEPTSTAGRSWRARPEPGGPLTAHVHPRPSVAAGFLGGSVLSGGAARSRPTVTGMSTNTRPTAIPPGG